MKLNKKRFFQILANILILYAIYLFIELLVENLGGTTDQNIQHLAGTTGTGLLYILLFKLSLPAHLVSVGIYLQRNFISRFLGKYAKIMVISTGVWLGITFIIRYYFLNPIY